MSFSHTTQQIRDRTKDVTRRKGWENLKKGDRLRAVRKAMGLKRGEKVEDLAIIEVVSVRREPIRRVRNDDVKREGFPGMHWHHFAAMLCNITGLRPVDLVTRIEFRYVD